MWLYEKTCSWLAELSLTGWLVLSIVLVVTYNYLSRSPWKRLPPGPPAFPVIGSLPFLGGDVRKVFSQMANTYGDVFTIYIGSTRMVILNKYDVIKEALLKTPKIFDCRSDIFKDIDNRTGIISSDGVVWKEQRHFILHTLRTFGLGTCSLPDLIQDEAQHLVNSLKSAAAVPFNPQLQIRKAAANIITVILFGERRQYDDREHTEMLQQIFEVAEIVGANNPAMFFKPLRYIPGDPFKYNKIISVIQALFKSWRVCIEQRKEMMQNDVEFVPKDLISLYIKQIPNWNEHGDFAYFEEHLLNVIRDMFAAGTDTTSNTLAWAILYLIRNPDIQDKVHAEIDDVIGCDRLPVLQDQLGMPYTQAVISEVQRIADVAPMAVPHSTEEDTVLRGYTIPKGTVIIPNLHSVHWDSDLWPDPETFDPERFLDAEGKYRKRDELIAFGLGKRSCLGENLAKMELFIFFTNLLQKFSFNAPPGQSLPSTDGVIGITHHPKDFDVIITIR